MSSISSVGDIARVHAANNAEKVALIYQARQWTYGQLDQESNKVANALLAAGVNPQDRVAHDVLLDQGNHIDLTIRDVTDALHHQWWRHITSLEEDHLLRDTHTLS